MEINYKHSGKEVERIVYIWARYSGKRDESKEGKHYCKSDINDLIRRLIRYKDDINSFDEGFEKDSESADKTGREK